MGTDMILLVLVLLAVLVAMGIRALEWLQQIATMLAENKDNDYII